MLKKHPILFLISIVLVLFVAFAWFAYTIVEGGVVTKTVSNIKNISLEPAFKSLPKDSQLHDVFNKHRSEFVELKDMFLADKVSSLDNRVIVHEGDYKHATFFPYSLGDVPKNARMSRDQFNLYMNKMKIVGATRLNNLAEDGNEKTKSKSADYICKGVLFHLYDNSDSETDSRCSKYIVYWKSDNFKSVPDTDAEPLDKNGEINEQNRLEPHWFIWKFERVVKAKSQKTKAK